jgi:hypothetical protein
MLVPEERVASPSEATCRDLDALVPRLRRAGGNTVLSADPLMHPALKARGELKPERVAPFGLHVYDLATPLPRFGVAAKVVPVESAGEGARLAAQPGFLEAGGVAVEGGRAASGASGRIEILKASPGRLDLEVEADSPTALVVRDGWAAGWRARVDGEKAVVHRSNGRHQAVQVPAGRSVVRLRYRPGGLFPGLALSVLAAACLVGLLWQRRAQGSPADPPPRA